MKPLKYIMVSVTTGVQYIYIHGEKQLYGKNRNIQGGKVYLCGIRGCKSKIVKVNQDFFKKYPHIEHNHSENREEKFKEMLKRVLIMRTMQRMFKDEKHASLKAVRKKLENKIGYIRRNTVHTIQKAIYGTRKESNAGIVITVEPVEIIPKHKIVKGSSFV